MVQAYRDKLRDLSRMKTLEAWYSYLDYKALIDMTEDTQLKKRRKKVLAKALSRDSVEEFVKLGHVVGGKPRIKDQPPLIYHQEGHDTPEYKARILESVDRYRQSLSVERRVLFDRYELVDNAIKCGMGEAVSEEELIEKPRNAPIPITLLDEMYQFAYSELQAASNTKLRVGVFTEAKSNPIYYAGNACGCSSDTKKRKRFAGTSTTGKTIPSCGSTCP